MIKDKQYRRIAPRYYQEITNLYNNDGYTYKKIAKYLSDKYNIVVSATYVSQKIRDYIQPTLEKTQEVLAEAAAHKAINYIEIMDNKIRKLDILTNKLLDSKDDKKLYLASTLIKDLNTLIQTQIKTGGGAQDNVIINETYVLEGLMAHNKEFDAQNNYALAAPEKPVEATFEITEPEPIHIIDEPVRPRPAFLPKRTRYKPGQLY